MAATSIGTRLTEAHRLTQARLGAQIVRQVLASWGLIDLRDIDASTARWLDVVTPVIQRQIGESARLAAEYMRLFRTIETGGTFAPVIALGSPAEAISTSLLVTGPVSLKTSIGQGVPLERAIEIAKVKSSGAAVRHALSGGRNTILATIDADPVAVGYGRATSAKPCHFCAMLAGRGHVYKSKQSAAFKPHGRCHCEPEAAYDVGAPLPPAAQRFGALWNESTRGHSGTDAVNAFRRAYERPAAN